jgi:hypothetical protein
MGSRRRNPDFRVVRSLRRELGIVEPGELPPLDPYADERIPLTEEEIANGYRMAPQGPRTALGGRDARMMDTRPLDWDMALGEPLARGRTREKENTE